MLKHLAVLAFAALAAVPAARAQQAEDPVAAPRIAYQVAWSADQRKLDEAVRSLNGRFATALERVQADARERGDLDEALAARQLAEAIAPLVSNPVFRVGGGIAQVYALPDPPDAGTLTRSGFSNYEAKVAALLDAFNEAASNRFVQYLATLDQLVRDETRRGALESAVKIREERAARVAEGAPRITLNTRPPPAVEEAAAPVGDFTHAALGRWRLPNGAERVLGADRSVTSVSRDGTEEPPGRLLPINPRTVDIKHADGHFSRCTLLDSRTMDVVSRQLSGEIRRYRAERVGGEEPAPAPVEEPAEPAAGQPTGFVGRWVFAKDTYSVRVFQADGNVQYLGPDGSVRKQAEYHKIDETEAEVAAADGWIDNYVIQRDGTIKLEARHGTEAPMVFFGRRDSAAAATTAASTASAAPVIGVWQPVAMTGLYAVVVAANRTVFSPKHSGTWSYDPATRQLEVNWVDIAPSRYQLTPDGEGLDQLGGSNGWRRWADAAQRARNRARLPEGQPLFNLVAGDWTKGGDTRQGIYSYDAAGRVTKFENEQRERIIDRGQYFLFRDEGLMVIRWSSVWRDYFQLPPGASEFKGWNSVGEATVRMRVPPR